MELTAEAAFINTPEEAIRLLAVVCGLQQSMLLDTMTALLQNGIALPGRISPFSKASTEMINSVDDWLQRVYNVDTAAEGLIRPSAD